MKKTRKIIIFLVLSCTMLRSFAISLNSVATVTTTFFKRSAQASSFVTTASILLAAKPELFGISSSNVAKGLDGFGLCLFNYLFIFPASTRCTETSNALYGILNIIKNKSIFEVPVSNLKISTFLQGISASLALLSIAKHIIEKNLVNKFVKKIEKNEKLNKFFEISRAVSVVITYASTALTAISGIVESGEKILTP